MSSIWDDFFNEEAFILEDNSDSDDDMEVDTGDDAGADAQSDDTSTTDDTTDGDDTSTDDQNTDDNNNQDDDNKDDDTNIDDDSETEPDSGDNMDTDDDNNQDDQDNASDDQNTDGDDTSTDDDMGSDTGDDSNDPNAKLKDLEKSIFDQLSDEQKTLKIKELKSLYNNVYDKCGEIINSISDADRSPEQAKIYDYVMNSLTDLQKYIKDYLFQIYDSKTYIENMVQLQKYLTVLDTVSNIFEEVKNASDKQNKDN